MEPIIAPTIWMAARRKGLTAHRVLKAGTLTACGRSTRTGITLTVSEAHAAGAPWCQLCWLGGQPALAEGEGRELYDADTEPAAAHDSTLVRDPRRVATIAGIRQLADWLESHPQVPVDRVRAHFCVDTHLDDVEALQALRSVALAAGQEVKDKGNGQPEFTVDFGDGVEYQAFHVSRASMARHNALYSYSGAVTPDGAA